ncbi:MAG: hypothetical protein WBL40_05685 [Terrimicrobiaceae bacterium]
MKTTLDLPDDLLREAKVVAARRKTTLKDLVTRSLRREIGMGSIPPPGPDDLFEAGPLGILRLKRRDGAITPETVRMMQQQADEEDARRVREIAKLT